MGSQTFGNIYANDLIGASYHDTSPSLRYAFGLSSELTTLELANAWLAEQYNAGTPFTVIYQLAEEVIEPLADEYQSLFYQLESYDGVTYITTDSTVQPEIELEYALTDAGVHMLNNYATANIAELKADHNIDLTPAVKYVKESVTVTPDQDIETDVIDLKAVKLKAYDGYNVALTKYLLNFAYDFTEDTTSELVFRIPGVELTEESLVTASATCGYLKDGDPYLVSVNIYPDVNITTGYINLAISKADGTKFDESITSNHRFTVSVEIL